MRFGRKRFKFVMHDFISNREQKIEILEDEQFLTKLFNANTAVFRSALIPAFENAVRECAA